ncbi:MAG: ribonuclease III [Candidatus Gastranaerophilales bacterium]|nr:ribonuclease III [Candidatus Gastranaerophilales bacterium]
MINKKRKAELNELLQSLELTCHNYDRLDTALTHSSYTFENKLSPLESNERLEFLGDAVLKLIASDYLHERFPEYSEGELTKIRAILISDNTLADVANTINLSKYIKIGYHEERLGGRTRPSTQACAFEAMLGALYLDGKIHDLQLTLISLFEDIVTEIDQSASKHNFKAMIQEYTQAESAELPEYRILKEEGPPHSRTFDIGIFLNGELCGVGTGKSKKEAQQKAAEMAAKSLGLISEESEEENNE